MVALLCLISPSCAKASPKRARSSQRYLSPPAILPQNGKILVAPFASKRRDVEYSVKQENLNEHEWADIENLLHILHAEIKASSGNSHRISRIKEFVGPLYTAMPKTNDGLLSKEAARYAMHRYFTEYHGWSIKGLQPAASAWQNAIDVVEGTTEINKYMVPAYLQVAALLGTKKTNFDLDGLALLISVYEHLDYQTVLSTLFSIIATLDLPVAGDTAEDDIREILEAYLMIYAFGIDIDVVNRQDIHGTRTQLQQNQPAWQSLSTLIWDIKKQMFAKSSLDFGEIVQVLVAFGDKYAKWQEEDCTRAHNYLVGLPSFNVSSTLLSDVDSSNAEGRRDLFTEDIDFMRKLGSVLGDTSPRLVIPNYLNSQSMCLATASYHSVCCMNKCGALYAKLEQGVRAPAAKAEDLYGLLASLPDKANLDQMALVALQDIADEAGLIQLHGQSLAVWMHQTFPLECPQPLFEGHFTNPKTPDEWMETCENVDDPLGLFPQLMSELQTAWSISMGKGLQPLDRIRSSSEAQADAGSNDVIHVTRKEPTKARNSLLRWYFATLIVSALVFIVPTSMSVVKSFKRDTGCLTSILEEGIEGDLKCV